ncbi:hypothetical protein QVA66_03920 [Staphylococcus chromogenes]|nr:hypothetical protein [Staphylococcus chromogenes]
MRVLAKNTEFTGKVGQDTFVDGVCENASESQHFYYEAAGYTVEDSVEDSKDIGTEDEAPKPPAKNAGVAKWQEFLTTQGIEFSDDADKIALIELWENYNA